MPIVDTSILVRYLTGDSPDLTARAAEIVDSDEELIITDVIIVETAYVLTRLYKVERTYAVDTLIALIQRENIIVDGMDKSLAFEALLLCRPSNRISFADAFIWAAAKRRKEASIYAFDKRFPKEGIGIRG